MRHLRKTELKYPGLWRGCVGAWAPFLGPTGLTLRDWSGQKKHGTLTNFTIDAAWDLKGSGYSIKFDGVNDYIALPAISASTWTFSCWLWLRVITGTGFDRLFAQTNFQCEVGIDTSGRVNVYDGTAWRTFSGVVSTGVWTQVTCTFNGSQVASWLNGIANGSAISGGRAMSGTSFFGVAYTFLAQDQLDGNMDDIRIYNRVLSQNEITTLARRRGIAYDLAPMPMPYSQQAATFQPAWALRQKQILGGGGGLG